MEIVIVWPGRVRGMVRLKVEVKVRARARVRIGVRVRGDNFLRLPTTSHSILYSRVGPIAVFSHCQP